ncbi:MAG: hypothetical protein LBJ42_01360 [Holosporales bacterium]|nr:hypothetical protein [Holosporales bacterium]
MNSRKILTYTAMCAMTCSTILGSASAEFAGRDVAIEMLGKKLEEIQKKFQDEMDKLRGESGADKKTADEVAQIKKQLEEIAANIEELKKQIEELKTKLGELETQTKQSLEELTKRLDGLETQLSELKTEAGQQLEELKKRHDGLETQVSELKAQTDQMTKQIEDDQRQREEKSKRDEAKIAQLDTLVAEFNKLVADKSGQNNLAINQKEIASVIARVELLEAQAKRSGGTSAVGSVVGALTALGGLGKSAGGGQNSATVKRTPEEEDRYQELMEAMTSAGTDRKKLAALQKEFDEFNNDVARRNRTDKLPKYIFTGVNKKFNDKTLIIHIATESRAGRRPEAARLLGKQATPHDQSVINAICELITLGATIDETLTQITLMVTGAPTMRVTPPPETAENIEVTTVSDGQLHTVPKTEFLSMAVPIDPGQQSANQERDYRDNGSSGRQGGNQSSRQQSTSQERDYRDNGSSGRQGSNQSSRQQSASQERDYRDDGGVGRQGSNQGSRQQSANQADTNKRDGNRNTDAGTMVVMAVGSNEYYRIPTREFERIATKINTPKTMNVAGAKYSPLDAEAERTLTRYIGESARR